MGSSLTIPLGVVIAREKIDHPWLDTRWRPVSVFLNAPPAEWRTLRRGTDITHYHAATLPLELHRKETMAYQVNLANGEPSVYVVLREDPSFPPDRPVEVFLVTASPFEAQAYGESGFEIVDRVPMPEPLVVLVEEFIAAHHVDEPFVKRQRQKRQAEDEHKFGQEPINVLRERMRSKNQGGGSNG